MSYNLHGQCRVFVVLLLSCSCTIISRQLHDIDPSVIVYDFDYYCVVYDVYKKASNHESKELSLYKYTEFSVLNSNALSNPAQNV